MYVASTQGILIYFFKKTYINYAITVPSIAKTFALQILANVAANLLVLDLCMAIAFTTILIAATLNAKDDISIDEDEASWLGKIKDYTGWFENNYIG